MDEQRVFSIDFGYNVALLCSSPPGDANASGCPSNPCRASGMSMFSKEMSILDALEQHPSARAVFESHGMACCLCLGASLESIEAGAIMHQVDPDEVVAELNDLPLPTAS